MSGYEKERAMGFSPEIEITTVS